MKLKIRSLLTISILVLSLCSALQAQSVRQITTTLLPLDSLEPAGERGLLWVQNKPEQDAILRFDLSVLPPGLAKTDFKRCTLRLVAETVVYKPKDNPSAGSAEIKVKGRLENSQDPSPIVSLSTIFKQDVVGIKDSDELRQAVYDQYSKDKKIISLKLFTDTDKASSLFYSTKNFGADPNKSPSNIPRLVIEYTLGPPSLLEAMSWLQHQQNPEHTGRNPWVSFIPPAGFSINKIDIPAIDSQTGTIVDYPLIYQGNIYLVYKVLEKNYLLALDFKGNKLKQKDIGEGTVERSPVISRNGIFYIVNTKRIAAYDLNRDLEFFASYDGEPFTSYAVAGKLSRYTDLTVGNDGSLFLVLLGGNNVNYVYGFTADLKPFLKTGAFSEENENISTATVSVDGKRIFTQTPKGAAVIDITNPSEERITALQNGQRKAQNYYHVPIAGPAKCVNEKDEDRYMIFSDFANNANQGNVWGYVSKENRGGGETTSRIWNASGSLVPQPVLGSNGLVYFIQDSKLEGHAYCKRGSAEVSKGEKLNTTSNLVMDGANNIYFWDSGVLRGYNPDGVSLFAKTDQASDLLKRPANPPDKDEPEQFIRLMAAPDGTLWANNQNASSLYAFKPSYARSDLSLGAADLEPTQKNPEAPRVYRTTGKLTVKDSAALKDNATLKAGTNTLFQANESIAFGNGFTVEKGASLLCRTGF